MKKHTLILLLLNSLFSFSQEFIDYPTIDTYVEYSNPAQSFSTETALKLKHSFSGENERVAYLQFPKNESTSSYEQVLLKLVKTGGNEGNVSLVGINSTINSSISWNSKPTEETVFAYGGIKDDDVYYIDVTEYILNQDNSFISFKIFTNSLISSSITFDANETSESNNKPQLQYYTSKKYDIPLFDVHDKTTIDMVSRGEYTAELIKNHNEIDARNNYGGWENGTFEATGFFRTEQDCENTWHIIDPSGNIFYSAGLNSVDDGGGLSQPDELNNLGLNTMGSWSDEDIKDIAYTPRFNVMVNFSRSSEDITATFNLDIIPVFEPTFESFCNNLATEELQPYLNDPWVLGYFLDNELLFHRDQLSLSLGLNTSNAQYQAADAWMINKYGSSYTINDITDDDVQEYQGYVGETYFKTVSEAFRAVDPNHMLLGTRFHSTIKNRPLMFEAAGRYMDIVSVNYYGRFEPEEDNMEMWLERAGKPFMITEFYTKANDVGLSNIDGAGWEIATQEDRAIWFENWMLKLLRNKGNVGFHWFRFIDNPDNDANKGVYDKDYNIYQELAGSIEKISKPIYTLRSQILYGNYNYNNCSFVKDLTLDTFSFFSEENENIIFPNPVETTTTFQGIQNTTLDVYDMNGRMLLTTNIDYINEKIDLSMLPTGIYYARLINSERKKTLKIIKK